MKLVFYEIKKVLCKKVFYIVLALCLLLNVFVFYSVHTNSGNVDTNYITYSSEYNQMIDEYSQYTIDEAEQKLVDNQTAYVILSEMNGMALTESDEDFQSYAQSLEDYKISNPQAYDKALKMSQNNDYCEYDEVFTTDLLTQIEYIKSYPDFIDDMHNRADEQSSFIMFSDKNDFSYKGLYKTADDYKHLSGTSLSIGNNNPVNSVTSFNITDYFLIAMIFLVCIYLFNAEREKGLYNLVRATKNGRFKTIISKLIALFSITAVIAVVFLLSNFIVSTCIYGGWDTSRSIQSIAEFRNCIFEVSTGGFCLLFTLGKIACAILISSILSTLFICLSNSTVTYIASGAILAVEFLLNVLIPSTSAFNYPKYINIFYFLDGKNFWGNYLNLNLFSNPASAWIVDLIVFAVVFVVCIIATSIVFSVKAQTKSVSIINKLIEKIRLKFFKIKGSTSVFSGEIYKYFVQNKICLLLLAIIAFGVFSSFGSVIYSVSEPEDIAYKSYMQYLEGDITPEKEDYIFEQQQYFEKLELRIDEIYNSSLADKTKENMVTTIEGVLQSNGLGFERVLEQYNSLLTLKDEGVNARFIDETLYSDFLFNSSREWNNFILLVIMLIISIPFIFTIEYKNKMIDLIRPTKNGKIKLVFTKMILALITLLITFLSVYLPYFIKFANTHGTKSFSTPICCISQYFEAGKELTVIGSFTLNCVIYFIIGLFCLSAIMLISVMCKNHLLTLIISTVILVIPCLILYTNTSLRVGAIFSADWIVALIIIVTTIVLLTAICTFATGAIFTKFKPRRKNG